jgi:hypothetical protein
MIAELFMRAQSHKWWRDALEGDVDAAACVVKACVSGVLVCCDKQFYACVPNEYGSWMWSAITDDAVRLFIKFCFVRALHCDNNVDPAGEEDSMDRDFKVQDIRSEDEPKEAEVAEEASVDDAFTEQWCKRVAQQCKNTLRNDSFKSKLGSTARQWQPFLDGVRDVNAHDARVRPAQPDDYVDAKQTVDYVFGIGDADLAATQACDELEDAMLVACGDVKSTFDYLYAMLALYFTGIKTPQRLCFVLLGEGGNFKTSFVELLRLLLGALYVPLADETVTKRFAAAKPRPDLASLCGAYVAANDDLDGNLLSAPVRQLLGDGSIAIRRPYAPVQESIEPRCHLLVGGHCGMRIVSQVNDCQRPGATLARARHAGGVYSSRPVPAQRPVCRGGVARSHAGADEESATGAGAPPDRQGAAMRSAVRRQFLLADRLPRGAGGHRDVSRRQLRRLVSHVVAHRDRRSAQ